MKFLSLFNTSSTQITPRYVIVIGSAIGLVASLLQAIERIEWAARPDGGLACDLSSSFSCSSVFGAWQSSVFGFSNALLCLTFFAVMLGFGLAYLAVKDISRTARMIAHFFSLFFLAFGAWYLTQTIFVIGALCIYCIGCYGGVIAINWAWLRLNQGEIRHASLREWIKKGYDTVFWICYALLFVVLYFVKFGF